VITIEIVLTKGTEQGHVKFDQTFPSWYQEVFNSFPQILGKLKGIREEMRMKKTVFQ
jgi:hypothetical protein